MNLSIYRIDLHVHTCLSPCADDGMIPFSIVTTSKERGIDAIGICDHNSAENVRECVKAGNRAGLKVFPGMEVTSGEEVHLLALFEDCDSALKLQDTIYSSLPDNKDFSTGRQDIVNEWGDVKGQCGKLLIGASALPIDDVVERIHSLGGLAVASHVDREGFSIIGQLGMIPDGLPLDAVEVSSASQTHTAKRNFSFCRDFPVVASSDAHSLEQLGMCATEMLLTDINISEIRKAMRGVEGRTVLKGGFVVEDLSLHLLDIAENSINAGADLIEMEIDESVRGILTITVADNGCGMDEEMLKTVTDPFVTSRTTRKVGLGLSLFEESARATGGSLRIESNKGKGTEVRTRFFNDHIDMKPLGDIASTMITLVVGNPDVDFNFRWKKADVEFHFSTREVKEVMGVERISSPEAIQIVNTFIKEGLKGLV
ncbi:MAG: PHP domain-containing protein [Deltaproteobacteria bacterium]|nr:PHP domain-containing protein [Deltaproteobacteria bacterium]